MRPFLSTGLSVKGPQLRKFCVGVWLGGNSEDVNRRADSLPGSQNYCLGSLQQGRTLKTLCSKGTLELWSHR